MAAPSIGPALIAAGLGIVTLAALSFTPPASGAFAIHGVELGMTASEVVQRFDAGSTGRWSEASGCAGRSLEWSRGDAAPAKAPFFARFEFQDGLLMAARVRVTPEDPSARGAPLETSAQVVLSREPRDDGSSAIVLLARGCPEHEAEVEQLLSGGPVRR
ncbi:hypothetical protein WME89_00830 [Sorangium sp. So ce321]|uniref:hypothetical protein n=1 Tax=Sorangium sp. So ce321 TaxID=3133300 RepID=UPI003F638A7C